MPEKKNEGTDLQRGDAMREIKFRVWDKKRKIMVIYDSPNKPLHHNFMMIFNYYGVGVEECKGRTPIEFEDHSELMQYTGLKGKNKKEIYEGDIISFTFITGSEFGRAGYVIYEEKCIIEFDKAKFLLKRISKEGDEELDDIKHYEWTLDCVFRNGERDSIEVIGNIYENPELLK